MLTLQTPSGVKYCLSRAPKFPAPTLFVFAADVETTLTNNDYIEAGEVLREKGVLLVSLDLPCHGEQQRSGEPHALWGWRARLDADENFVEDFTAQARVVLDDLIEREYSDVQRIAAAGTSRGGFMALHFAAADSRIQSVAAFAPVTNLFALEEFQNLKHQSLTQSLDLIHHAEKFEDRALWISIGNADLRVSTDDCIAFARRVAKARGDIEAVANIELHVMPCLGHHTPPRAHHAAASWLWTRLNK